MADFQQSFPITLSQTEDGSEIIVNVTGTVESNNDFIVLVDAEVVRSADPTSTEHFFAAKKYVAASCQ